MPKGRRANPSTTRDGIWVRKVATVRPESGSLGPFGTWRQGRACRRDGQKKKKKKKHNSHGFRFKQCGNLQIYPESLTATMQKQIFNIDANYQTGKNVPLMYKEREKGLGVRKFQEKCQHYSPNYYFLAHEQIPSSNAYHSVYQTSFVQYPDIKHSILGRFPKSHIDKCIALHSAPKNDYMWFSKCYTGSNHITPTEVTKCSEPEKLSTAEEEIK
ncbi:testis-expressed protein 36 isoform X2 [Crotalus tigris]|uniref:testis-expressed protein 36 isoform X2 n=1 Tax=Crotalus tigris TaxID=88082 RepID=UPI00192F363A|nr:testis-expressed protein 36 isoform X2 [Crotalus tigris]